MALAVPIHLGKRKNVATNSRHLVAVSSQINTPNNLLATSRFARMQISFTYYP